MATNLLNSYGLEQQLNLVKICKGLDEKEMTEN